MKKSDLKIGEEYAIYLDPSTARNRYRSRSNKPLRAKLVSLNDTVVHDTVTSIGFPPSYGGGIRKYDRTAVKGGKKQIEVSETGIVVQLIGETVERGKISPSGLYVESGSWRDERRLPYPVEWYRDGPDDYSPRKVSTVALKNAGCFVSTWAEYQQAQKEEREAAQKRGEEAAREKREAEENDPKMRERLEDVKRALLDHGLDLEVSYGWDEDEDRREPDTIEGKRGDVTMIRLQLLYHGGDHFVPKGTPLVGWKIDRMHPLMLDKLLGI